MTAGNMHFDIRGKAKSIHAILLDVSVLNLRKYFFVFLVLQGESRFCTLGPESSYILPGWRFHLFHALS